MTRKGVDPAMLDVLYKPTPATEIRQRQGPGGRMLDYVTARYVMDRLDELGPEHWQDQYVDRTDGSVRCGIGVLVEGEWVWKWDVGAPSDIEPEKGSYSEAFKRAGVKWGIARDLYGDHASPHGRSGPPSAAPVPLPRPAAPPPSAGGTLQEPPELAEMFGETRTDDGVCPDHGKPWKENSRGFYCATKVGDGWCQRKPERRWIASREMG